MDSFKFLLNCFGYSSIKIASILLSDVSVKQKCRRYVDEEFVEFHLQRSVSKILKFWNLDETTIFYEVLPSRS